MTKFVFVTVLFIECFSYYEMHQIDLPHQEYKQNISNRRHNICVSYKILKDKFKMDCKVEDFYFFLQFVHKDLPIGNCGLPPPNFNSIRKCFMNDTFMIEQNGQTKVATLTISTAKYDVSGNWTCQFGSFAETVSVGFPELKDCFTDWWAVVCVFVLIALVQFVVIIILCRKRKRVEGSGIYFNFHTGQDVRGTAPYVPSSFNINNCRHVTEHELDHPADIGQGLNEDNDQSGVANRNNIRGNDEEADVANRNNLNEKDVKANASDRGPMNDLCDTCGLKVMCALCVYCLKFFCEICCDAHLKIYSGHPVCEVAHYFKSKKIVKCRCTINDGKFICRECKMVVCSSCKFQHNKHENKLLLLNPLTPKFDDGESNILNQSDVSYLYSFKIDQKKTNNALRVCGIAFLTERRIGIADANNGLFLVFEHDNFKFSTELSAEPRGVTAMKQNYVAITFGYDLSVCVYKVGDDKIQEERSINIADILHQSLWNAKPFSIAYSENDSGSGFLAVEVGEGDNGKILILTEMLKHYKTIENRSDFAYFTGNTIRLAFDMTGREKIFISSMSKKEVSCINLAGELIWTKSIPSPRSLIAVPDQTISDKNIILSSRRCNAIFRFNKETGDHDVVIKEINQPRYIAYHQNAKLLCVLTSGSGLGDVSDKVSIYKYNDIKDQLS